MVESTAIMNMAITVLEREIEMTMMRRVILLWDVNTLIGNVTPGGMVILHGDAPTWKYCIAYYRAVAAGASVVAIGYGIDVTEDASGCIVAYSTAEDYAIGKPISQRLGEGLVLSNGLIATPIPDKN